jgi:hypothetical protein
VLVLPDGAGSSSEVRRCNESEPVVERPVIAKPCSNLADTGRCAAHEHRDRPGRVDRGCSTPKPFSSDGGEATLKVCGVGVAMLPGQSWAPP